MYRVTGEIRQQDDLGITSIGGRRLRGGVSVLWRMSSPARVGAICWGQGSHHGPSAARGRSPQAGAAAPWSSWSDYFLSIICISRWKDKMGEGITYRGSTLGRTPEPQARAHALAGGECVGERLRQPDSSPPVLSTALDAQTPTQERGIRRTMRPPEGGCLIPTASLSSPMAPPHPTPFPTTFPGTLVPSHLPLLSIPFPLP